jgi:hypothetical protein
LGRLFWTFKVPPSSRKPGLHWLARRADIATDFDKVPLEDLAANKNSRAIASSTVKDFRKIVGNKLELSS